jgi:8-oxo-dGTP pyrophosphatase MutT (NUDIX family)
MKRDIRYQGAIVKDDQVLLIRHREHETGRSYWLFPGGGIEPDETDAACVAREMREETGVEVIVERLLYEEQTPQSNYYQRRQTFLCTIVSGEPSPGYEPEIEAHENYGIVEVRWFDLRDIASWSDVLTTDAITYPQLLRLRAALGYTDASSARVDE